MSFLSEVFKKAPEFLGKAVPDDTSELPFDRLTSADHIKLQAHYDMWRKRVRAAAKNDILMSNGWAFAMMSGVAAFESHVRADTTIRQLYFNKSGEVESTVDEIAAKLNGKHLNGIMVYGYGNMLRESHFIEAATKTGLLKKGRIYLIDCSLVYHIFAQSQLNPLRASITPTRRIRPVLLDYCENDKCSKRLKFLRDDLTPLRPVMHLFLGNTFCNVEAPILNSILEATVQPGDMVVAEYANYSVEAVKTLAPDYVNVMAARSAAELFATIDDKVVAKTVAAGDNAKAISITVPDCDHTGSVVFRSMLRRIFKQQELLNGPYELVRSCEVLSGDLTMDTYLRMPRPT